MVSPIVIILVACITLVVGDAGHARHEKLLEKIANFPDSSFREQLQTLHSSVHHFSGPQIGGTATELPEPATDAMWNTAVCKGRKMIAQMSYSDYDVAQLLPNPKDTVQSPWGYADLKKWGYNMFYSPPDYRDYSAGKYWGISTVLKGMKYTDVCGRKPGEWKALSIQHMDGSTKPLKEQIYTDPSGKVKRATAAYFYMSVLEGAGIMAQNRHGPWDALQALHPLDYAAEEVPELQRSSDMMWAMWEYAVPSDQRQNLEMFSTLAIGNQKTLALISRALKSLGKELSRAPTVIEMNTEEGKALLSSPNGAGFAHFLIERKAQVGHKRIDVVLLFECESARSSPCMVFGVEDVEVPTPRPKDDATPKDPKGDDPNNRDVTKDPEQAPPGLLPPGETREEEITRRLEKQNFVRSHTFKLDAYGNVTLSSSLHQERTT
ncbi:hypothetical protein HBH64_030150 [Parastagonospora nodorum]|nr:hypothetical protein HBH52_089600 [Parastagonospora nodorum]KAH4180177.1 hypothetical protein HBH43_000550 [Parastagonospora nodorum]KAH4294592.1 hypothetical protein HBI02_180930 [Parastagonospora nodorum]KAH4307133.1 hypothetical protein HBI01_048660 [Parastagonospora nodorum]KAH4336741.1 hypothetical protein HBI00_012250 [Parastagonospora nodorum]